jgi:aerobic-type carbon monoxide dehydrogenase small subunit (CoxS/CutS family)
MRYLKAGSKTEINFYLNGKPVKGMAEPRRLLVDFLRHDLGLTGTHVGCEHGVCGACTIRINGKATRSCLLYAVQMTGKTIETIESLGDDDKLNSLQLAFQKNHALQCGFCTPGILMSLTQLIEEEPHADVERIKDVLTGHLCRCTGYENIISAALEVLEKKEGEKSV